MRKIQFLLLFAIAACTQDLRPAKQDLSPELIKKEAMNYAGFQDFVMAQYANFSNLQTLDQTAKNRLLEIRNNLNLSASSPEFKKTLLEIDKLTRYQDWSSYIFDFKLKLTNEYTFTDSFFNENFLIIIRDQMINNPSIRTGRAAGFLSPSIFIFLNKLVACTNQCSAEAKEIESDGSLEDETMKISWKAGCIRGCVIYSNS